MSQPPLLISSSPHVHSGDSIPQLMRMVIWALLPATALSVVMFGWPALLVIMITTLSAMVTEAVFMRIRGRPSPVGDMSAALTGLLLALTLPPYAPWWICVAGGVFAIAIAKQLHGGLGYNIFNPALISRVFLLISFPVEMTSWPQPRPLFHGGAYSFGEALSIIMNQAGAKAAGLLDAVSAASPLGQVRMEVSLGHTVHEALTLNYHYSDMEAAMGYVNGSLGETSAILLALGGFYLLYKKVITWHIPAAMLLGCLIPATLFAIFDPAKYADPIFHLVTGGLIIGAFFMATDMVTSPVSPKGQIIFGVGCGLLTYIIRTWGGYPEGVSFAVVIMNATVPLIDQYTRPTVYGKAKQKS